MAGMADRRGAGLMNGYGAKYGLDGVSPHRLWIWDIVRFANVFENLAEKWPVLMVESRG